MANQSELARAARTARDLFKGHLQIRVVVRAGEVLVQATDLAIWYEARISWSSSPETLDVFGPSREVAKYVSKFGLPRRDTFRTTSIADWGSPPDGELVASAEIDRAFLLSVAHAACADETRFHMLGVHVRGRDGALEALATDGHRGAIATRNREESFAPVTVPSRLVRALGKYCPGEVAVEHGPGFVRLRVCRLGITETLTSRPVEGEFPPLERVFDIDYVAASALVDRARLADAVPRVGATTDEGHARIEINESCEKVFASDRGPDHEVVYRAPMKSASGREVVAVDAGYLAEALESMPDEWVELQILRPRKEKELRDAIKRMKGLTPATRIIRLEQDLADLRKQSPSSVIVKTQDGSWRAMIMARRV